MAKKGYWIASVEVNDEKRYKDYVAAGAKIYQSYGAKFLVRGGQVTGAEGKWRSRNVVVEFPSYQQAVDCYNSAEYAKARAIRQEVAESQFIIVEGYEE